MSRFTLSQLPILPQIARGIKSIIEIYWLSLIILVALLLRLPHLDGSFWLDEAAQALESVRPLSQQLDIVADFQPPLLHYITHFASRVSISEWWLRLWGALLPGLVSILYTYKLGRKFFSAALTSAVTILLATNSFHIFYSQELRPYMLAACWGIVSTYYLTRLWQRPNNKNTLIYIATTILGALSMYVYPFMILGQISATMYAAKDKLARVTASLAVATILSLPLLPLFMQQLQAGQQVRLDLPGWETVVSTPQLEALPLTIGKFVYGVLLLDPTIFVLVTVLLGLALGGSVLRSVGKRMSHKGATFSSSISVLMLFLLVPLISSWLFSFWLPVVQPKRLLFLLPFFYYVALVVARRFGSRLIALMFFSLFLLINLWSTFSYYTNPKLQRENWRQLYSEIQQSYSPDSSIMIFSFPGPFAPWRWYAADHYPTLSTGQLTVPSKQELVNILEPLPEFHTLLVFDYLRDLTDPDNTLESVITEQYGFKQVDSIDKENIGFVRVFERPNPLE